MQAAQRTGVIQPTDLSQQRVAAVVQTLANMNYRGGALAEVAHDARNMVTALSLYCDLLSEPGVLDESFAHYASELRIIAAASRRLVEKLMLADRSESLSVPILPMPSLPQKLHAGPIGPADSEPQPVIDNFQKELLSNRNLLDAIAGPAVAISVRTEGGARPVQLGPADLTRILMNLVKNSAEAMGGSGQVEITLRELPDDQGEAASIALILDDSGPGIREELLDTIFDPGYTTHTENADARHDGGWASVHRGLGLAITRSLVQAAGGTIWAGNRPQGGARFLIELPIRAL